MQGNDLFKEIEKQIMKEKKTKSVSAPVLAERLGINTEEVAHLKDRELTPKDIRKLLEKQKQVSEKELVAKSIIPIIEFLEIDFTESRSGSKWELFSEKRENGERHPYYSGLKDRLKTSHGIYIFHDSRGRAIYAGKAQRTTLWAEMNNVFNRDRGDIQNIKRVDHPTRRGNYDVNAIQRRLIKKGNVPLHDIARYCSAYEVPDALIGKFEALIIRSFANDLLNARVERI